MPRAELEALQQERLRALVARLAERVPFYTRRLDKAGIETSNVALDELDRLPSTAAVTSRCVTQTRGSSVVR
jgi:phenylacetate-coenzyme A ligase PaaK-like adenylate-forming protein